ncbi:hypothetical protein QTG56_22290 (plasmid) [Rossellomorea sp. AcN35-11]|nr:hypothetical protein [Rossellomorea aquimaris]WJV32106.1 hypothetical protein QTG56_22290 [Rossellomorea sp. AcN35-11]
MGVVKEKPKNHSKLYTDEDVDYILENLGYMSFKEIGKRLGRRPENIEVKLTNMGIDIKAVLGYLSANQLAQIIGVDGKVVTKWINTKGLPAKRKYIRVGTQKSSQKVKPSYLIDINMFWGWAEKNKNLLNLRKMDPREYMPRWASALRFEQLRESQLPPLRYNFSVGA